MSHFRQLKLLCGVTTIHVNVHSGNFFNRSLSTIILPVLLLGKTILFELFRSSAMVVINSRMCTLKFTGNWASVMSQK